MIDASKESYEENVRQTMEVVDYCHGLGGVSVEGELGLIMGVEEQIQVVEDEAALCNPEQALEFVDRTGVDLLAPAIGTVHGVYKAKSPKVDFERFSKIAQLINGQGVRTPLVIHGGSGLPSDYVARLIELGGSKFNVSTDLKRTLIDTSYSYISENRDEYNPGKIDLIVKDAIREKIIYWIDMLGSPGKV
jgi:ketose-bisphosphate aldolase